MGLPPAVRRAGHPIVQALAYRVMMHGVNENAILTGWARDVFDAQVKGMTDRILGGQ